MAKIYFYQLSEKYHDREEHEIILVLIIGGKYRPQFRTGCYIKPERFIQEGTIWKDPQKDEKKSKFLKCSKYKIDIPKESIKNHTEKVYLEKKKEDLAKIENRLKSIGNAIEGHEEYMNRESFDKIIKILDKYGVSTDKINFEEIENLLELEIKEEQKQAEKKPFFELLDDFRNTSKKKVHGKRTGDKSDVWKKNFDVLVRALKRYEWFVKLTKDKDFTLDIDTISKHTLSGFESFLRDEHKLLERYPKIFKKIPANIDKRRSPKPQPRGNNAICALFNKLKSFNTWCLEEGKTINNPFIGYYGVNSEIYGLPYYITLEERNQIADFDLSDNPSLEAQRDIFIFQCCVGCRVSDLMRLEPKDIIDDVLQYIPQKTKGIKPITIYVPLNERAKSLVKKYSGKDKEGRLFPFISSQKYNEAIKKIFEVCGITRLVSVLNPLTGEEEKRPINEVASSHMARRCFVGNLYQKVQDPALIASMSGHSEHSRAFSRYRKIDDEMKKEVVNLID